MYLFTKGTLNLISTELSTKKKMLYSEKSNFSEQNEEWRTGMIKHGTSKHEPSQGEKIERI